MDAIGAFFVAMIALFGISIVLFGRPKPPKKPDKTYRVEQFDNP